MVDHEGNADEETLLTHMKNEAKDDSPVICNTHRSRLNVNTIVAWVASSILLGGRIFLAIEIAKSSPGNLRSSVTVFDCD
jgi:hypothetical protein